MMSNMKIDSWYKSSMGKITMYLCMADLDNKRMGLKDRLNTVRKGERRKSLEKWIGRGCFQNQSNRKVYEKCWKCIKRKWWLKKRLIRNIKTESLLKKTGQDWAIFDTGL